jgi:pyrimidine deaminase RibD-like protein
VGCVLVRGDRVVARGHNLANTRKDATRHAELVAIEKIVPRHTLGQGCTAGTSAAGVAEIGEDCVEEGGDERIDRGRLLEVRQ